MLALADVRVPVLRVGGDNAPEALRHRAGIEAKVDEARAGDVRVAHRRALQVHPPDQIVRDLLRLPLEWFRQRHGEVRRPLAKRRVARPLEDGRHRIGRAKVAGRARQLVSDEIGCGHSLSLPFVLPDGLLSVVFAASDLGAAALSDLGPVAEPASPFAESPPLALDSPPELDPVVSATRSCGARSCRSP